MVSGSGLFRSRHVPRPSPASSQAVVAELLRSSSSLAGVNYATAYLMRQPRERFSGRDCCSTQWMATVQFVALMWEETGDAKQKARRVSRAQWRGFLANRFARVHRELRENSFAKLCAQYSSDAATCWQALHCSACTACACGFVERRV